MNRKILKYCKILKYYKKYYITFEDLQKVLQNLKSIAINITSSIAKFQKYYNKFCKISKVLQKLLDNFKQIIISIA